MLIEVVGEEIVAILVDLEQFTLCRLSIDVLVEELVIDSLIDADPLARVYTSHLLKNVLEFTAELVAIKDLPEILFVFMCQAFVIRVCELGPPKGLQL